MTNDDPMTNDDSAADDIRRFEQRLKAIRPRSPQFSLNDLAEDQVAKPVSPKVVAAPITSHYWSSVAASWICGAFVGATSLWWFAPRTVIVEAAPAITSEQPSTEPLIASNDAVAPPNETVDDQAPADSSLRSPRSSQSATTAIATNVNPPADLFSEAIVGRAWQLRSREIALFNPPQRGERPAVVNDPAQPLEQIDFKASPIRPITTRQDLMRDLFSSEFIGFSNRSANTSKARG